MVVLRLILAFAFGSQLACLATTPQEEEPAVQGDYEDGDEEHRPGQPCLLCHSSEGHFPRAPGEKTFEIGGTVYGFIDDAEDQGIEGVEIYFTDATGYQFTARSNRVGNFLVEVDGSLSEPVQGRKGVLKIPRKPRYPLEVTVVRGDEHQRMKTKIWRNGSCAHCHGPEPGADSVGRVYLFDRRPF